MKTKKYAKKAKEIMDRWIAQCNNMDSPVSIDLMASELLSAILEEETQKLVAEGLHLAAKECELRKTTATQLKFKDAYVLACGELFVSISAMENRVKNGEYEQSVSDVSNFENPSSNEDPE
jgi:hypothetical protein